MHNNPVNSPGIDTRTGESKPKKTNLYIYASMASLICQNNFNSKFLCQSYVAFDLLNL